MKLVRRTLLSHNSPKPTKALEVLIDDNGWYWIKNLVIKEGWSTPFFSMDEIEVALDIKLHIIKEENIDIDANIYIQTFSK